LSISAGSRVLIPYPTKGFRSYLAINGTIQADRILTSVSADPLLGVGHRLAAGDTLTFASRYAGHPGAELGRLFRLGAQRPALRSPVTVRVIEGPDLGRLTRGRGALDATFRVRPQSNHVGLRLESPLIEQNSTMEIPSRGVPIGAVEVPPTGGIIILLRGRLVTAGYPVVAVVTSESIDLLGQVRPGDDVRMSFCDVAGARARLRANASELALLSRRVQNVFRAKGLAAALDPALTTDPEENP
jgi:allophanate hydrolase subunit 2